MTPETNNRIWKLLLIVLITSGLVAYNINRSRQASRLAVEFGLMSEKTNAARSQRILEAEAKLSMTELLTRLAHSRIYSTELLYGEEVEQLTPTQILIGKAEIFMAPTYQPGQLRIMCRDDGDFNIKYRVVYQRAKSRAFDDQNAPQEIGAHDFTIPVQPGVWNTVSFDLDSADEEENTIPVVHEFDGQTRVIGSVPYYDCTAKKRVALRSTPLIFSRDIQMFYLINPFARFIVNTADPEMPEFLDISTTLENDTKNFEATREEN